MNLTISLPKYLLICAIGFGLGGALWGWILFKGIPEIEFPFHYLAIIIMGLFGGVSLSLFSKSIKEISKTVLAGFLGFGIGFVMAAIFNYPLYLYGGLLFSIIAAPFINAESLINFVNLSPGIGIGGFWLVFLFIGVIIGLFYALFLRTKIWSLIWRSGLGFALGSLIGPVMGNLLGNLFNSLLVSYLITFSLMGIILGLFLSWGMYKYREVEIKS